MITKQQSSHGNTSIFNLLIIVLIGVLIYVLYTRERLDGYLPEDYRYATRFAASKAAAESENDQPAATPPATHTATPATTTAATPTAAAPSPRATPASATPAPAASNGQSLAQFSSVPRSRWPRQVAVMREIEVQIVAGGRVAGSMKAKPGTLFELVDIQGENVQIRAGGKLETLPAGETDVLFRFRQLAR